VKENEGERENLTVGVGIRGEREKHPEKVFFPLEEKVPTPWEALTEGELETEGVWVG